MNSVNNNTNIIYFFLTLYLASTLLVTKKFDLPITLQILLKYHNLFTHSYNIIFRWLPSYVGITGNEKADKAAKSALNNWWLVFTTVIVVVGRVRCLLVVRIMIGAYHCYNRSNCRNVTLFIVFRVCATKAGFSSVSWMNLAVFGCDDNSYPCHSNCHWWKHELSHVAQPNVISVFCWWLFIVISDNVFVCQCLLALLMYYWC